MKFGVQEYSGICRNSIYRNKNGKAGIEEGIVGRWKEYIENLFNHKREYNRQVEEEQGETIVFFY